MIFIETSVFTRQVLALLSDEEYATSVFTRQVLALLSDEEYAAFQSRLSSNPAAGDVIEGTGGLRKVRVAANGHGKRGGARVIHCVRQRRRTDPLAVDLRQGAER